MDDAMMRHVQMEAAEALLDAGVRVPIGSLRLPFRKRPIEICVTMKRPCLAGQIRIAKLYLSLGVTSEQMWQFTKEEEMKFLAEHGGKIAKMIAMTIVRNPIARRLRYRLMTWIVKNRMSNEHLIGAMLRFVSLMGTDSFMPIIKSAERTNPMTLRKSQEKKGS